jgi:ATP-dependent RNA helicase MSS116
MLRQGLRRCTQLRCAAAAPVVVRQQLSILASVQRPTSAALKATTSRILATSSPRWYSSEAAAVEQPASGEAASGAPTHFAQLANSEYNVNETLIKNITHGMGYEKMSAVQSATIAPALKGMDL